MYFQKGRKVSISCGLFCINILSLECPKLGQQYDTSWSCFYFYFCVTGRNIFCTAGQEIAPHLQMQNYVWFNDGVTAGRSPVLHCAVGLGLGFATGDFVCKLCCPRVVLLCQWFASSLYDWKNVAQRKMLRKEKCSPKIEQKCDNGPESWDSTTQNSRRQFVNCIQPS